MAKHTDDSGWIDCRDLRSDPASGGDGIGRESGLGRITLTTARCTTFRLIEPDRSETLVPIEGAPTPSKGATANAKAKAALAAKAKAEAEAKKRAEAEAEAKAEAEARAQARAMARAKAEADAKAAREAEEKARAKAEKKAQEEARKKEKQEAEKKRREDESRAKAEAEAKAKAEAAAKAKAAAEAAAKAAAKAKAEAEAKAKREAEAKARREAEQKAREEAKRKAKLEAEARARAAAEEKAKREAERKALAQAKAKAKIEAEARARAEAQAKAKREAEAAALAKAKREAEEEAKAEAAKKAQAEAERKAKEKAEAERKAKEKAEAERKAKEEAKAKEQARKKAEAEVRKKALAERKAKEKAEAKAAKEAKDGKEAEAKSLADAAEKAANLGDTFRRLIRETGPISLAHYMAESNARYYTSRDPLGAEGDFITAPEVSQMFGELIGLWFADLWVKMGSRKHIHFVELGPGRGTLSQDALRTAARYDLTPQHHMVETSPALRKIQREAFPDVIHHDDLSTLPDDAPLLIVGNEFFDALPVHQLIRSANGWHERLVGLEEDEFVFVAGDKPMDAIVPKSWKSASQGTMIETSAAASAVMAEIAGRLKEQGGAALIIDYGPFELRSGSTLQALKAHQKVDVFDHPGQADLTAHVDFEMLGQVAKANGADLMGVEMQGDWLRAMGIDLRFEALQMNNPNDAEKLKRQYDRLVDDAQMGTLFKVMGVCGRRWPDGAGFSPS